MEIINKLLSRHLISYARDEKWLHDIMDAKKDRSQLYKKAMKHYILTAGDPEFQNVDIPTVNLKPVVTQGKPPEYYNHYHSVPKKYEELQAEDVIIPGDPDKITVDADEINDIMGGLK